MVDVDRGFAGNVQRSKPEASRPSKPSERTPTAQLDGKLRPCESTMSDELLAESHSKCVVVLYGRVPRTRAVFSYVREAELLRPGKDEIWMDESPMRLDLPSLVPAKQLGPCRHSWALALTFKSFFCWYRLQTSIP